MEINELLKMISSIDQKKGKCRGNLRLKVLLKTTHEYARRSWIDGKSGNPQKLQILLKNSIPLVNQSPPSTEVDIADDNEPSSVEQVDSLEKVNSAQVTPVGKSDLPNNTSTESNENDHNLTETPKTKYVNASKDLLNSNPNRRKILKSILKNTKCVTKTDDSGLIRKIKHLKKNGSKKKILRALLVHFKRNNENQDSGEQQINRDLIRKIKQIFKKKNKTKKVEIIFNRKSRKRPFSDVEDDCEELLNLDGFFNKLKALKFSDDV